MRELELTIRAPAEDASAEDIINLFYVAMLYTSVRIGTMIDTGSSSSIAKDALHELIHESELGNVQAQYYVGDIYLHDYLKMGLQAEGVKLLEKSFAAGCDNDFVPLADCFRLGQYTKQDEKKAGRIYRAAAKMGNPDGIYRLGYCYDFGIGMKENKEKAKKLYKEAAEKGNQDAASKISTDDIGQLRGGSRPWRFLLGAPSVFYNMI